MAAVAACALAEAANVDRVARTGEPGKKLLEMFKVFLKKSPTRINGREPQNACPRARRARPRARRARRSRCVRMSADQHLLLIHASTTKKHLTIFS